MIRLVASIVIAVSLAHAVPVQPVVAPPVDEAGKDAGFVAYREALIEAVVGRDIDAILSMSAQDIQLSFGGAEGHEALREFLTVSPGRFASEYRHEAPAMRMRNWADLETVLRMGGVFDGDGRFVAPYTWSVQPPEGMDPFEVMIVTGTGVAMRDRPIRYGKVVAWLDHEVVRHVNWISGTSYVEIARAKGGTGYVHREYLRALVDYRATFQNRDGDWKMISFVAGD